MWSTKHRWSPALSLEPLAPFTASSLDYEQTRVFTSWSRELTSGLPHLGSTHLTTNNVGLLRLHGSKTACLPTCFRKQTLSLFPGSRMCENCSKVRRKPSRCPWLQRAGREIPVVQANLKGSPEPTKPSLPRDGKAWIPHPHHSWLRDWAHQCLLQSSLCLR